MHGRSGAFGSVDNVEQNSSGFYKLADATINAIIGDGTFDLLADQAGYNSAYSDGNHEYVIVRNHTATFFVHLGGAVELELRPLSSVVGPIIPPRSELLTLLSSAPPARARRSPATSR